MPAYVSELLQIVVPAAAGGLVAGLVILRFMPETAQQWSKGTQALQWYWYGLFAVLFAIFTLANANAGNLAHATISGLFVVLQLAAMFHSLLTRPTTDSEATPAGDKA